MKKIVLTGGGTAGHVTPNLALVPLLREAGYEILYIGSKNGMEKDLVKKEGIPYVGISSGKLRRYASIENLKDPFRIQHGFHEAIGILRKFKPDIVFSKGGFVSVPVVGAARFWRIPAITHESDMTVGLANKLNLRSVKKICCNFPETAKDLPEKKAVVTGCPLRAELFEGNPETGKTLTGLTGEKPVLMIIGGSLGAVAVNEAVRDALPLLLQDFQVLHLCGKGNLSAEHAGTPGYVQIEYATDELKHFFALADVVISRAGANAICELAALHKPNILIPLPTAASRGDQLLNAESFKTQGFSDVLLQSDITPELLHERVLTLYKEKDRYISAMEKADFKNAAEKVVALIKQYTK